MSEESVSLESLIENQKAIIVRAQNSLLSLKQSEGLVLLSGAENLLKLYKGLKVLEEAPSVIDAGEF
jgi:hypothetical protein